MTAAAATAALAPAPAPRWLFGPLPDLVLGCGVGYLAVFAALCAFGGEVRTAVAPGLVALLSVLIGAPHYGATLLRVYERREDRRAYAIFAVWVTGLLALAFVVATRSAWLGSLLITIYLSWSPWHYTGQNYGLAVLFLRRRGVLLDAGTKRFVYASFLLSFAVTFVAMHRGSDGTAYAPALYEGYRVLPIGFGPAADVLIALLGAAWLAALAGAGFRLLRRGRPGDLGPAALLALTQALWFPVPVLARHYGVTLGIEPLAAQHSSYYFFYAAFGHSIQYVWVTSYYAARAPGFRGYGPYIARALGAGTALWVLPALLFAPDLLGKLPFDLGLGALVGAVVNLHHFVLDGAIWKLRDGRIARVLVRSERESAPAPAPARAPRPWLAPVAWAAAAASLAALLLAAIETEVGIRRAFARGDAARIQLALARLDHVGRESPTLHLQLGRLYAGRGDHGAALRQYQRSLELYETPEAWVAVADQREAVGDLGAAQQALGRALEVAPQQGAIAYRAGRVAERRGQLELARTLFERADALEPGRKLYEMAIARVREGAEPPSTPPGGSVAAGR